MFFEEIGHIRFLSAFEWSWGKKDQWVAGRPFSALTLRIQGNCILTQGEKTEHPKAGDVMYMPRGISYHFKSDGGKMFAVHFESDIVSSQQMELLHPQDLPSVRLLFEQLIAAYSQPSDPYGFNTLSLLYKLLHELCPKEETKSSLEYEKLRPAIDHLHIHYTDSDLNIDTLCRKAFMSDTYFRRLFTSIYGQTPLHYLNRLRIEHAKALLREGSCSVAEVAAGSGFSDPKYFSTVFRAQTGQSPSVFRKESSAHLFSEEADENL